MARSQRSFVRSIALREAHATWVAPVLVALLGAALWGGQSAAAASPRSLIGVNYGTLFSSTPLAYSLVVDLLQKNGFSKVRSPLENDKNVKGEVHSE